MQVKFHPLAEARLLEIWDYTEKTWGEVQADLYIGELLGAANAIPHRRQLWRSVEDADLPSVCFVRFRHHFIFFRELSSGIGVINILHENMDIPQRLRQGFETSE